MGGWVGGVSVGVSARHGLLSGTLLKCGRGHRCRRSYVCSQRLLVSTSLLRWRWLLSVMLRLSGLLNSVP